MIALWSLPGLPQSPRRRDDGGACETQYGQPPPHFRCQAGSFWKDSAAMLREARCTAAWQPSTASHSWCFWSVVWDL